MVLTTTDITGCGACCGWHGVHLRFRFVLPSIVTGRTNLGSGTGPPPLASKTGRIRGFQAGIVCYLARLPQFQYLLSREANVTG